MTESVEDEFDDSGTYGLSVFSSPGLDAESTAERAGLPHSRFFRSTVGAIRAAGFDVVSDQESETGHALIMFYEMPTTDDWTKLKSVFEGSFPNPRT